MQVSVAFLTNTIFVAQARVDNGNQEQNGPMSNMQNPSCPNSTQADGNG
jgi:hypothetical protein